MTRVERRKRRRRRQRALWLRLLLTAGLIVMMLLLIRHRPPMQAERIGQPTPTPETRAYDQTVVTREVTLPEEIWYTIQTGVFSGEEAAQEKAAAYSDRGAPGTVVADGSKWRVFIASYGSEADAASVRRRLGEQQRVETYLYAWRCPELRLRLSGMAGQLDTAEAGLTLFSQSAAMLRDSATLLDASQLTVEEVCLTITEMDGQIVLWTETALKRFGRQPPELIAQLLMLGDAWTARRSALEKAAESATTLSAELKGQGMSMYADMIRLREKLNAQ